MQFFLKGFQRDALWWMHTVARHDSQRMHYGGTGLYPPRSQGPGVILFVPVYYVRRGVVPPGWTNPFLWDISPKHNLSDSPPQDDIHNF